MNGFFIFIVRVILAMIFSVFLTRFFHPEKSMVFIIGIGIFLLSMTYILEYVKHKKTKNHGDSSS